MKTIGSRRDVFIGYALKTRGGLTRRQLKKNPHGKIVSFKKSSMAKKVKYNPLMQRKMLIPRGSKEFGVQQMLDNKTRKRKSTKFHRRRSAKYRKKC
jgi:hypothetical protein